MTTLCHYNLLVNEMSGIEINVTANKMILDRKSNRIPNHLVIIKYMYQPCMYSEIEKVMQ